MHNERSNPTIATPRCTETRDREKFRNILPPNRIRLYLKQRNRREFGKITISYGTKNRKQCQEDKATITLRQHMYKKKKNQRDF